MNFLQDIELGKFSKNLWRKKLDICEKLLDFFFVKYLLKTISRH